MEFMTWARNQWDRIAAWVLVAIGALALVLGWVGVTSTPYTFKQIPFVVSGGLAGLFLLGVGAMLWVSADLRDEWRKLAELVEVLERQHESGPSEPEHVGSGDATTAEGTVAEVRSENGSGSSRRPSRRT